MAIPEPMKQEELERRTNELGDLFHEWTKMARPDGLLTAEIQYLMAKLFIMLRKCYLFPEVHGIVHAVLYNTEEALQRHNEDVTLAEQWRHLGVEGVEMFQAAEQPNTPDTVPSDWQSE